MGFQFALSSVLRLREVVEEREERLLQSILGEISRTNEFLERTATEIAAADAARFADVRRPSSGFEVHAHYGHLEVLKKQKKDLEERLDKLEELRNKQMIVYQAARRNREMLDGMHDQQRTAYETDAARREQRALDDTFASQRARR